MGSNDNIKTLKKGEILFKEGDFGNKGYILISGKVAVKRGNEKIVIIDKSGEFFGELGAIVEEYRDYTVVSMEETKFIVISAENFERTIVLNQKAHSKLTKILATRLSITKNELEEYKLNDKNFPKNVSFDNIKKFIPYKEKFKLFEKICDEFLELNEDDKQKIMKFKNNSILSKNIKEDFIRSFLTKSSAYSIYKEEILKLYILRQKPSGVSLTNKREKFDVTVRFKTLDSQIHYKGISLDVSVGGMYIITDKFLVTGTKININIILPKGKIDQMAEVIWLKKKEDNENKYHIGLSFDSLKPLNKVLIEEYIAQNSLTKA